MKSERRSAAAVMAAVMLTVLAAGAAPPATCGLRLLSPATRTGVADPDPGPELLTATCGAGAQVTLTKTCGAEGAMRQRLALTGGRHLYRLPGCPAEAGKETLSVSYD